MHKAQLAAAVAAVLGFALQGPAVAADAVDGKENVKVKPAPSKLADKKEKGKEGSCKGKEGSCKAKECKDKKSKECKEKKGKESSCKGKESSCKSKEGSSESEE